ncbi:response regulator [Halarcobacter bivalviorum]|uniref:DNA-binding response regulator n=1 Tax=Halarcobacter bivalviorum TaxID=663364 RepID=A0AAX2AA14_9BACT|nr:response regulator [Halarcobacter bivalviorum]AXH11282.1 two-component system response regulator [Halarcobacter bivalviorum]RXK09551.1 DNA-binding response regulator [Halarcobacter bivalviorum]
MKIKVLIVEDEILIAMDIKNTIEKLGHEVIDTVTNCDDALKSIQRELPDLLFVDINLGKNKKDGIDTVLEIRKNNNIPVVYISAFNDKDTIERAAETYPLNYLAKPYKRDNIKATLIILIYKLKQKKFKNKNNFLHLGYDYYYDQQNERLYYKEELIQIGSQEKILLSLLIEAKGNIVSKDTILYNVWKENYVSQSSVRTLVYRLRNKLNHQLIETIPYHGFRLITTN